MKGRTRMEGWPKVDNVFVFIFWILFLACLAISRAGRHKVFWPLLALGLLLLFNQLATPGFFHVEIRDHHLYGTPIDILNHGAKVMLLALGMTLVIATGGVDLSVGAVMAIAGAVSAQAVVALELPFATAAFAAMAVAALAGAWNGALVAYFRVQPIVATLILMVAGRGLAQLISDGQIVTFTDPAFTYIGNGHFLGLPFTLTLVLVMLGATYALTNGTALGLFITAVGDNETAAHYSGIDPRRLKFLVYVFCGFCAGLAGMVAASNIKSADANHAGLYLELDAILAVVVGGTLLTGGRFYLLGSVVGALLIQTLTTTMYARDVSSEIAPVPKALVILAVCILQSDTARKRLARFFQRRTT